MTKYFVKHTDSNKSPIEIDEKSIDETSTDITLFGRLRLNYGRQLNENFIHILENFSCPEDISNPGNPDLNETNYNLLEQPTEGQTWFNSTSGTPFFWDGNDWIPLVEFGSELGANWGQILDGENLPQPVSPNGYVFDYDECSWIVSPFVFDNVLDYVTCRTVDANALVEMEFSRDGEGTIESGIANYLIVGIKDNNNMGTELPIPSPTPTPTGTPTPTPTQTPTQTPGGTPTPTPSTGSLSLQINNSRFFASCTGVSNCTATTGSGGNPATAQDCPPSTTNEYCVTGGTPPYTFDWNHANGSGEAFTVNNATTATPEFSRFFGTSFISRSGTKFVRIEDSLGVELIAEYTFLTIHNEMGVSPTPTATSTATATPTSTPASTPTPTPTPSPAESHINDGLITSSSNALIDPLCPAEFYYAIIDFNSNINNNLITDGTAVSKRCCTPEDNCGPGGAGDGCCLQLPSSTTYNWTDDGSIMGSRSDYTWTITNITGSGGSYSGPSQFQSGSFAVGSSPAFVLEYNGSISPASRQITMNIVHGPTGDSGTITINLNLFGS